MIDPKKCRGCQTEDWFLPDGTPKIDAVYLEWHHGNAAYFCNYQCLALWCQQQMLEALDE